MSETVGAAKSTGAVAPVAGQGPPGRGAAGQTGGGPGGANGAPVAVVDPPDWLASLKPGEAVTGTVRELTADGRAVVDTLRGVLLLDRQAGLDAGRAVRLQVVASEPSRVDLLLLPERQAPRPAAPPSPVALRPGAVVSGHFIPAAGPAAGQAAGQAAGAAPLAAASSPGAPAAPPAATAVTTGPAAATTSSPPSGIIIADPPAALRALPSGARLAASVVERLADGRTVLQTEHGQVAVTLPTAMATGAVMRLQVVAAGALLELAPVEAGAAARAPAGPATEGRLRARVQTVAQRLGTALGGLAGRAPAAAREAAPLTVRVLAVSAPEAPPAPGIGGAPGRILSGTVTSSAAQGPTVIRTDGGEFVVRAASEVATGSRVVLQVLATPGTVLPSTPADVLAQSLQNLAHGWPALVEALQALAEGEPQLAAQVTQAALPQTGPQLTTGVLFFLSALFGGRLQDWLGRDALRALERHGPILRRLDEDFGQLARFAKEPVSGEWRAVMLPLMHDGELHQLRLFLRRQRGAAPEEDEAGTRFLLEADFSRLGPLQLDGLVRGRRFDLVVRTTRALPPHMRSDIGDIFAEAGAAANFAGGVTFQVTANFPVAPLDGVAGHALGLFA